MNEAPKGTVTVEEILPYLDRDRYMGKREAARYLGVSLRTLETWTAEMGMPRFRPHAKLLFKRSELDRWMERYRERPADLDLDKMAEEAAREVSTGARK
jgi:excisionase family DNA binding protein